MVRYGNQEPTFSRIGDYSYSDGAEAVSLFNEMGSTFYPCQEKELEYFLARNEDGRISAKTICISKPRQNGKSFSARHYAIWMAVVEGASVLFSAHHSKTVRKMFKQVADMFEANDDLRDMLLPGNRGIYRAQGMEGIYLTNNGMIEFASRTNSQARGATYSVVIVDEAQELTDEQFDAMNPTTIASDSGDPQKIFLGTPPNEKCPGTVFDDYHFKAHNDDETSIWWIEWAIEEIPENQKDPEIWYRYNPAMGYRIREDVMADASNTTKPLSFAREYLGYWTPRKAKIETAIDFSNWEQCSTDNPPTDGAITYSVKFSPDGATGTLAVCQHSEKPHVEVIQVRSMAGGLSWFADWLEERADGSSAICIDGMSNAQPLIDELIRRGVNKRKLIKPKSNDMTTACSLFLNSVNENKLTHYNQEQLNEAVKTVTKRNIGSNGGFGFYGDGAELIEACALALWCVGNKQSNPNKKMRVSF